jgi:hypothetical protein
MLLLLPRAAWYYNQKCYTEHGKHLEKVKAAQLQPPPPPRAGCRWQREGGACTPAGRWGGVCLPLAAARRTRAQRVK